MALFPCFTYLQLVFACALYINRFLVTKQVRCFECKSFGTLEDDLVQCTYRGCNKYYHKNCMKNWRQKKTSAAFAMVCPRHDCDVCVDYKIKKWSKLYRCLHCPVAYHEACAPDGINLLEDIPGYMICGKHDDEWKHENQVRSCIFTSLEMNFGLWHYHDCYHSWVKCFISVAWCGLCTVFISVLLGPLKLYRKFSKLWVAIELSLESIKNPCFREAFRPTFDNL